MVSPIFIVTAKADFSAIGIWGRRHELIDGNYKGANCFIMTGNFCFQIGQFVGQFFVCGQHLSKLDERAYHQNTDFNGTRRIQDTGCHDSAVFGKRVWQNWGIFQFGEVVAICDRLGFFLCGPLK